MEVESSKSAIKIGLEDFTSLSKELFDSLVTIEEGRSQYRDSFREPELIMRDLIRVDRKLQEDVLKLKEEQIFFNKILAIRHRLKEKEGEIISLQTNLKRSDEVLRNLIDSSQESLEKIESSQKTKIDLHDLVTYSHFISKTLSEVQFEELSSKNREPFPPFTLLSRSKLYNYTDEEPITEIKEEITSFQMETEVSSQLLTALGVIKSDSVKRGEFSLNNQITEQEDIDDLGF